MNVSEEAEIKKEFQLERLAFFSDAVFAIIITIMVLDVKMPELHRNPTELESRNAFLDLIPKLLAYLLSFFIIGNFWIRHLQVFSFLKSYNRRLLEINLLFLFAVSLFPFSLSFVFSGAHVMQYNWGISTYIGIVYFSIFMQTVLIGYLIRHKKTLCHNEEIIESSLTWKSRRIYYFVIPLVFILMALINYFHWKMNILYYSLIVLGVGMKLIQRKYYPDYKEERISFWSLIKRRNKRRKLTKT
jgi:uncharacterized membrane protein